eukprot:jgi/Tetstr1/428079/TSEL_018134.t1
MRRGIQVDLSEVNDSIAELEEQLAIDVEAIESSLASTDSNVEGLSNTVTAAAPAVSSLEDDLVALSNFTHDCCDEAAAVSNVDPSSYIPQAEKRRFIVDLIEPKAIGAHDDNAGRVGVIATLRSPLGLSSISASHQTRGAKCMPTG